MGFSYKNDHFGVEIGGTIIFGNIHIWGIPWGYNNLLHWPFTNFLGHPSKETCIRGIEDFLGQTPSQDAWKNNKM